MPPESGASSFFRRQWPLLLTAPLGAPLLAHAYVGWFSRYLADDYCYNALLRDLGIVGGWLRMYTGWSGRFGGWFAGAPIYWLGPAVPRFVAATVIATLGLGVFLVVRRLLQGCDQASSPGLPATLSLLTCYLVLELSPNVYQSVYWLDGMLFHTLPIVLACYFAAWMLSRPREEPGRLSRSLQIAVTGAGAFFLAVFNEVFTSVFLVCLAVSVIVIRVSRGSREAWVSGQNLSAALAGGLLGTAVVLVAPGSHNRQAVFASPPNLGALLLASFKDAGHFLKELSVASPMPIAAVALLAFALGAFAFRFGRQEPAGTLARRWLVASPLLGAVLLLAIMTPHEYAVFAYPTGRVLILAVFVFAVLLISWCVAAGWLFGVWIRRKEEPGPQARAVVGMVLALGMILAALQGTTRALSILPDAEEFADAWDARDARIRAGVLEGAQVMYVPSLSSMGTTEELAYDETNWVNVCIADYYNLDAILAK